MSVEYVEFHAASRPDAIAIIDNGREITYGALARDIRKCIGALREVGLTRGARAAIVCGEFYFGWVLRLACEDLSLVTAKFLSREAMQELPWLRDFDVILSSSPTVPPETGGRHASEILVRPDDILARPDPGEAPMSKAADDPISLIYTSGTTGTPKQLLLTRRIFQRRVEKLMWFAGFTRASRYLVAVQTTARTHAACLCAGATIVFEDRITVAEAIAAHAITHITLPPIVLKRTLDELPERFKKPPELMVLSLGASVSDALRDAALERLATEVCDLYGSNEVGFVSSGTSASGSIWPGTQIGIVDDGDKPVPNGETGWIRIKTDCMVQGYLDDPEATARMFRDGWFYTQDLGRLHGDRQLQIIGRGDDVLNIGWVKLAPSELEDRVLKFVPAGDVGICSIASPEGIEEICIMLSEVRCGDHEIIGGIKRAFEQLQIGKFRALKLDRIPRNANGKIQRAELKRLATAMVQPR